MRFTKAALWSEKTVGTNAIETCLYLNELIQTIGAEHYGTHISILVPPTN
ncbi:hypothetical protein [Metaclostridioides mangenotii]|nr:hypothetical protein [Clostridioides mangenotii]